MGEICVLQAMADWITFGLFGLDPASRFGESLNFFIYDSSKLILLLSLMIFVISYVRSFFSPEKTRLVLARFNQWVGYLLAAVFGIVTPFCSCSSVPLFIGFVEAGIPLGVTFSFLVASPLVNEVSLVMLFGWFGGVVAVTYVLAGVVLAVASGAIIQRLNLQSEIREEVLAIKVGQLDDQTQMSAPARARFAWDSVKEIVSKVWVHVLIGIAIGAFIHGYVPADFLAKYAGRGNWLAVPLAVLFGVPLYSNAVGVIPIVQALIAKGVAPGTALGFMMSVTALSLPAFIILQRVMKPKLIIAFASIVTIGIIGIGYLFNAIL